MNHTKAFTALVALGLGGGASGPSGGDMTLAFGFTGSGFSLNVLSARVAQAA